jgi:hypothetical protein
MTNTGLQELNGFTMKSFYIATVVRYWHMNRQEDRKNKTENPDTDPMSSGNLVYIKSGHLN